MITLYSEWSFYCNGTQGMYSSHVGQMTCTLESSNECQFTGTLFLDAQSPNPPPKLESNFEDSLIHVL